MNYTLFENITEQIGEITDSINVYDIQSLLTSINELECKNQITVTE